ncbi:PLP-dependent transferase [Pseudomonas rhodesiae]|uniref:PLP-dependent transferase n=1 Tax=Pseudomonas rhodesiae TaxID=76760 RepID=UPI0032B1BF31
MRYPDIKKVFEVAKQAQVKCVFDNTWSSSVFFCPIKFGADVVILSLSKCYGGTVGVALGAIVTCEKNMEIMFRKSSALHSSDTRYEVADCIPESVVDLIKASICRLCEILNFGRYARFDFIVREGIPYLLEVNTLPGLNAQSVFVKACLLSGVGYDEMICRIIGSSKV